MPPEAPPYPRWPDIAGETVVFAAAGDLWLVSARGGTARRLTALPGEESWPRFSPSGRRVAFTATVDGNPEVYVVDVADAPVADAAALSRLTWHPDPDLVVGWDGDAVLVRSRRAQVDGLTELYRVPVAAPGRIAREPWGVVAAAAYAGRSRAVVPWEPDGRAWDHYRGGMAPHVWVGEAGGPGLVDAGTGSQPTWVGGRVWFVDDPPSAGPEATVAGLHSVGPGGADRRPEGTLDVPVRWPESDGRRMVFVAGGDLYVLRPDGGGGRDGAQPHRLPVRLPAGEADAALAEREVAAAPWVEEAVVAPDGLVYLVARGRLVAVPPGAPGRLLPVAGARAGLLGVGPGGEVVGVVDLSGSLGEGLVRLDGARAGAVLPGTERIGWATPPAVAAGGGLVAAGCRDGGVRVVVPGEPLAVLVGRSAHAVPQVSGFAPDGETLAFVTTDIAGRGAVYRWSAAAGATRVTPPGVDARAAVWVGETLVAAIRGPVDAVMDDRDLAWVGRDGWRLWRLPEPGHGWATAELLPVECGRCDGPYARGEELVVVRRDAAGGGVVTAWRRGEGPRALGEIAAAETLAVGGGRLVAWGPGGVREVGGAAWALPAIPVDPRVEWRQLAGEVLRQARALALHGERLDPERWAAETERLLPRIRTRAELSDLLHSLLGALEEAHVYLAGGDGEPAPAGAPVWLLGGRAAWVDGLLRVAEAYEGAPSDGLPAPLGAVGLHPGDCVGAVNGQTVADHLPIEALLTGPTARIQWKECAGDGWGDAVVSLVRSERALLRADRARATAAQVADRTGGRVGYVRPYDLGTYGLGAFDRFYYAEPPREAWIVDLRGNGGGWLSDAFAERLRRPAAGAFTWRSGAVQPWPLYGAPPRLVVLVDGATRSEGEILAAGMQAEGRALIVGAPTWGGMSGIGATRPLVDGTVLGVPTVEWTDEDGVPWVVPDVVVPPAAPGAAGDAALDVAIERALGG